MRHLFALQPQLKIRFHLRRDIDGDTDQLRYFPLIVAQITATRDEPPCFTVRSQQPIFNFKCLRPRSRILNGFGHADPVFRMHTREK